MDFVKLCFQSPKLDCCSFPRGPTPRLDPDQVAQQRRLFTTLTDVFEVACVEHHKKDLDAETQKLFDDQWVGWDRCIRKFAARASYSKQGVARHPG